MNGQYAYMSNNRLPMHGQQGNPQLDNTVNELQRLIEEVKVKTETGFTSDEIAHELSKVVVLLIKINKESLFGVDQWRFSTSYIDMVVYLEKLCSPLLESSEKISRLREKILKEGWTRFNALHGRGVDLNDNDLKAYEYFAKSGLLQSEVYGYGQQTPNFNLFDDEDLDQAFNENKQYYLNLFREYFEALYTGRHSTLSEFMTQEFSNRVTLYRKLNSLK